MYRTDLFQKAGLTMPEKPTWDFVVDAAKKLTDKADGVCGDLSEGQGGLGQKHGPADGDVQHLLRRALVR